MRKAEYKCVRNGSVRGGKLCVKIVCVCECECVCVGGVFVLTDSKLVKFY